MHFVSGFFFYCWVGGCNARTQTTTTHKYHSKGGIAIGVQQIGRCIHADLFHFAARLLLHVLAVQICLASFGVVAVAVVASGGFGRCVVDLSGVGVGVLCVWVLCVSQSV